MSANFADEAILLAKQESLRFNLCNSLIQFRNLSLFESKIRLPEPDPNFS
jgi:hypothetical protein